MSQEIYSASRVPYFRAAAQELQAEGKAVNLNVTPIPNTETVMLNIDIDPRYRHSLHYIVAMRIEQEHQAQPIRKIAAAAD